MRRDDDDDDDGVCLSVCVFISRGTVIHGVCLSLCLCVSRGTVIHGVCLSLCLCVCYQRYSDARRLLVSLSLCLLAEVQ